MRALLDHEPTAAVAPPGSGSDRGGAGPDQGVIEEARRRQRARRIRIALTGALLVAGVAGVSWALAAGGSPTDPRAVRPSGGVGPAHAVASASVGFGIRLSPALDGGEYGWCVGVEEHPGVIAGGGCAATPVSSRPLAMELSSASRTLHEDSLVVLTTPQVAAILVNGRRRVATVALPGLPYGLRAARVVTHVSPVRHKDSRAGGRAFARPPAPAVVALDAHGRPIPNESVRGPFEPLNTSERGPCALRAGGLPGLAPQWSHVASAIRPFTGQLVGRAFFSCIDTEFYLRRRPLDAAILLDAAHPGVPPAAIPGLTPVPGQRGYLNGPGDFKGELTATRLRDAWLVVAGGSGVAQRIEVLRHLTPTVKL
jgi:hypothetical protein